MNIYYVDTCKCIIKLVFKIYMNIFNKKKIMYPIYYWDRSLESIESNSLGTLLFDSIESNESVGSNKNAIIGYSGPNGPNGPNGTVVVGPIGTGLFFV